MEASRLRNNVSILRNIVHGFRNMILFMVGYTTGGRREWTGMLLWALAIVWVAFSAGIGYAAYLTGRSWLRFSLISLFLTPFFAGYSLWRRNRLHGPRRWVDYS